MVLEAQKQHRATPVQKLSNPEEELAYLRERVAQKEEQLGTQGDELERERIAVREVREYHDTPAKEVLDEKYIQEPSDELLRSLDLSPEEHDAQVDELLRLIPEKGIKNVLAIVAKTGSAHLEDDVHRAVVQYIAKGLPMKGLSQSDRVWEPLHMTLFEVSLAISRGREEQDKAAELEKVLGAMEQFYLGTLSVLNGGKKSLLSNGHRRVFTVEVASRRGAEEVVFYVSVPSDKGELFIRHLVSMFPDVVIDEKKDDYNIFNENGFHAGAIASLEKHPAFPIKVYKDFTNDPMNALMSTFARLDKDKEGAAMQIVIGDDGPKHNNQYKKIIDKLRKGYKVSKAIWRGSSPWKNAAAQFGDAAKEALFGIQPHSSSGEKQIDQITMDLMTKKVSKRIVPTVIRVMASAETGPRAQEIVEQITSSFNQFDEGAGNSFKWIYVKGKELRRAISDFIMRVFGSSKIIYLSVEELTAVYHLTGRAVRIVRDLKRSKLAGIPAPIEVSEAKDDGDSIILGINKIGITETPVYFAREDRMRHFYEIGQTGTGKSFLLRQMIIQDIYNGDGCCFIDPHGSDIQDILQSIPRERWDDVIYFDPAYVDRPMGLNMYEYDPSAPEQKSFVVDEMLAIFEKLFGKVPESMGPMFQQYFRNSSLLLVDDPNNIGTLADVPRVMADKAFRDELLAKTKNPLVKQFWRSAEATSGEQSLENFVPYITSKTDIFLANEFMRPIVAQQKSAFNFKDIMNERKILLVNLSKGRLGELNSNLLGLVIVGKFLQAAFTRVNLPESKRYPFYLYIDEFQNFTTPSIATILSEARKYALSLNIAHQYIKQVDEEIRDAVFGNIGTKCVFRISHEDAEFIEKDFATDLSAEEIADVPNRHAYISMLVRGTPVRPFDIQTKLIHDTFDESQIEILKKMSYEKYGRPREEVEEEIINKYMKKAMKEQPVPDAFGSLGF